MTVNIVKAFNSVFLLLCTMLVTQSCPNICNPVDYSPPGSSVHGVSQERILEWIAGPSPGDLPDPTIEPDSPALQVDSLPRHQGSPTKNK